MSRKENDDNDFVATKAEKSFDDDGNIQVANAAVKKTLNIVPQKGNKAGTFKSVNYLLKKPAKVIKIDGSKKTIS
tara:strand:+ start:104 stop:328 length:225 start_codon:yes stop_codon:yes gene_type:complete